MSIAAAKLLFSPKSDYKRVFQSFWDSDPSNAIIAIYQGLAFTSREVFDFFGHSLEKFFEGNSTQPMRGRVALSWKSRVQREPKPLLGVRAHQNKPRNFCSKEMLV